MNTLRGSTKTLKAENLPAGITEDQIKAVFTTATSMRIVRRKFGSACFLDFANNEEAISAFDTHNNGRIGQSTVSLRNVIPCKACVTSVVLGDLHLATLQLLE